ncbi:MAG: hypothetical protein ACERKX_05685 [Anaerolineales bacterium]
MRKMLFTIIALFLIAACATTQPAPNSTPLSPTAIPTPIPTVTPVEVLFIGNSITYWNLGLDYYMEQLTGAAIPPLVIQTKSLANPDWTLEDHWEFSITHDAINEGNYDVVVLQSYIPYAGVETFQEYVRKFITESKNAGAEPVLFMPGHDYYRELYTMDEIAQAHFDIGLELGVDIAPVGLAWKRAMEERPELDMYYKDKIHPSVYGHYLAASVVYATVFGESPVGLTYLPSEGFGIDMTEEEAAFLQRIAWETVQEYQAQ